MQHRTRRDSAARRHFRSSVETIERRRREFVGDSRGPCASARPLARAAAATVLAAIFGPIVIAFAILTLDGVAAAVSPAFAAVDARRDEGHRAHRGATVRPRSTSLRHALRDAGRARQAKRALRGGHHLRRSHASAHADVRHGDPTSPAPATAPASTPLSSPQTTPPAAPALVAAPWRLTADGAWTTTVTLAPDGPAGLWPDDVAFSSDQADVLPLEMHAAPEPGAIVTAASSGQPVEVRASSPASGAAPVTLDLVTPSTDASTFAAAATAVGPHLVAVGWTMLDPSSGVEQYKIYRRQAGEAGGEQVAVVSPTGRAWHDGSVAPASHYDYTVVATLAVGSTHASTGDVATMPALPAGSASAIGGKGMFLYFGPTASEPGGFGGYDPDTVIARAKSAGIAHIELRMARGTFFEAASPDARAWLDRLIDDAAAAGISLVAWQVPRRATAGDAAQAVADAAYRTPAGNGFTALALDLEGGDRYMGADDVAADRMAEHIRIVRAAVGGGYPIIATVMSPRLTGWTNARYPYRRIARYATALQPMEYWHHFRDGRHDYGQDEVAADCARSVFLTLELAGRDLPVNVAGQSDDLGGTGSPSGDEIGWCLAAAKGAGAIGETFFDWRGTGEEDWSAIAAFPW